MPKFKPTPAEWAIIKEVALRGHDTCSVPIKSIAGVQLECRMNVNVNDRSKPIDINVLLVTEEPDTGWGDCDLHDRSKLWTDDFRKGVELTEAGDGIFDFYIYNRYDRDGDLAGNVLVEVRAGKMTRVWIEGGKDWSWTPTTGITPNALRRVAA